MPLIRKFEDVVAWQEARKLVKHVYEITRKGEFRKDWGLRDQIQRASVSSMNNIAEGFDCESNVEFARFLVIARRSPLKCNRFSIPRWTSNTLTRKLSGNCTTRP